MADDPDSLDRALSMAETVRYTALPRTTIWELRRAGDFPEAVVIGRRVLFRLHDLSAWLDSKKTTRVG